LQRSPVAILTAGSDCAAVGCAADLRRSRDSCVLITFYWDSGLNNPIFMSRGFSIRVIS